MIYNLLMYFGSTSWCADTRQPERLSPVGNGEERPQKVSPLSPRDLAAFPQFSNFNFSSVLLFPLLRPRLLSPAATEGKDKEEGGAKNPFHLIHSLAWGLRFCHRRVLKIVSSP